MQTKNIVIMAWRDKWHPNEGGAEIYITHVAEYLRDQGHNVTFMTSMYPGAKKEEIRDGITYIRRGNAISIYTILPSLFRRKFKKETDLLIENYNSIPFRIPKYFDNTLTVIHHLPETKDIWNHNYKFTNNKFIQFFLSSGMRLNTLLGNPIGNFFLYQLLNLYKENEKIISVSPSTEAELLEKGFLKKNMEIIYNGIEVPVREDIMKPSDKIKIGSIGRLRPTKNIHKGIEMIKYSIEELGIKNIELNIAGRGEEEERLKELTEKYGLEEHINFLGYISDEDRISFLRDTHLHIQFADKEGWGITIIEASAQATPTIVYNVPGLRDSVKPTTGYLVEESLEKTWERALEEIRNNAEEYKSKQKEGLKWATNFKWEEQLKKYDKYLD